MKVIIEYSKRRRSQFYKKPKIKFDRRDFWNLDHTLALVILPALKEFKRRSPSYPGNMDYDEKGEKLKGRALKGMKRWHKIMDQMIWSFEQISQDIYYEHPLYLKDPDTYWKKRNEGLTLFSEYYGHLWC